MSKRSAQTPKLSEKEMRAQDAALAMKEYQAEKLAVEARTARLRALRLAKEAEAAEAAAVTKPPRKGRGKS